MSDSDRPDSARTVVGFPTDGVVATPSPVTDPRGWPPRPPLPEPMLQQKTTKMAVVPPLAPPKPSDDEDPDEEPTTEPRPEARESTPPQAPRGRGRSRDGTMEIHAVDDLALATPSAAPPVVGRHTMVLEDDPVSGDEDTRKQARRRDPAATMMLAELPGGEHAGALSAEAISLARAAATATTEMQAFPVMLPEDVQQLPLEGQRDAPGSKKGGTAKIAQVDEVESPPASAPSPKPRRRARTVPVPEGARLRTTTLKSSEEAAEIAALRAQYAGAIRVPTVENASDETPPPSAAEAAGAAFDRLPLSFSRGGALSESFDDLDALPLSSTDDDGMVHVYDPGPSGPLDATAPSLGPPTSAVPQPVRPPQSLPRPSPPSRSTPSLSGKPAPPSIRATSTSSLRETSLRETSLREGPSSSRPAPSREPSTAPPPPPRVAPGSAPERGGAPPHHHPPLATPPLATPPLATPPLATPPLATPPLATPPPPPATPDRRAPSSSVGLADADGPPSGASPDDPFSIEDEPTAPESAIASEATSEDDTVDRKRDFELDEGVAPLAMRPIGRLGGDDGGSGLALDFSKPGIVVDEDTVPPSQRPPPLPGGHACEADRLDAWLDAFEGEPITAPPALPATQAPGTMDVAAVFGNLTRAALPFDDASNAARPPLGLSEDTPPPPAIPKPRRTAATQAVSIDEFREALPFMQGGGLAPIEPGPTAATDPPFVPAPFDPSEADRLEQWLRGHLDGDAPDAGPWPLAAHQPVEVVRAIAPNPIRDARLPMVAPKAPVSLVRSEPASQVLLLSIEAYAQVKVAVWDRNLELLAALDELDVDEPKWRDNELRVADALAREAREGQAQLATALRQAIRKLRAATRGDEELVPLERYAETRVALEAARVIDEAPELVLARLELSPESWETARAAWAKRARQDPSLAREVRRAVAKARREAKARARAEQGAASAPAEL